MFKTNSIESAKQLLECMDNATIEIKGNIKDIMPLMKTEFWPSAVPEGLIVKNDDQAKLRARSILYSFDIIDIASSPDKQSLMDKPLPKLLDYGCGQGHVVMAAKEMGVDAYGYDIDKKWKTDHTQLSTDITTIKKNAPYSHILIYDVIDHVPRKQAIALLNNVKEMSDETTKIIVRTHPWLSRHGAHTYYKLNKAYAHLFLDENDLSKYTEEKVEKVLTPMKYYTDLFKESGLKVVSTDPINKPVDAFFKTPILLEHIKKVTNNPPEQWIDTVLAFEFIDYKLSK